MRFVVWCLIKRTTASVAVGVGDSVGGSQIGFGDRDWDYSFGAQLVVYSQVHWGDDILEAFLLVREDGVSFG